MSKKKFPFLETIYHLRTIEQIILYNSIHQIPEDESAECALFLESEYEREGLNYPYVLPTFNRKAALWAAKTVYYAAQLVLNRDLSLKEVKDFLKPYEEVLDAQAFLSADLCLRFLPQIVVELKHIDSNDGIISLLEEWLQQFHYSAIGYDLTDKNPNLRFMEERSCFSQLYLDRVLERKDVVLASLPLLTKCLKEDFGDYKKIFWNEL